MRQRRKQQNSDMAEEKNPSTTVVPKPSIVHNVFILAVCLIAGCVFGIAMEKGRVFEPESIRLQFVFERWVMLKMFLAAMGTSALVFSLLSVLPWTNRRMTGALVDFQSTMAGRNVLGVIVGAAVLGIGMALSGACPGMVLPQAGAWVFNAFVTLIGALLGTLIYGLLHEVLFAKLFKKDVFVVAGQAHDMIRVRFLIVSIPLGIAMLLVVGLLEYLVVWTDDYNKNVGHNNSPSNFLEHFAWPPSVCGCIIGLCQVFIVLAVQDTLGGSSAYATVVAQAFVTRGMQQRFPFFADRRLGMANWWQVLYVIGGVIGGAVSSLLSQSWSNVPGVTWPYALVGGICLTLGSRIAGGCTSGHGLSGAGMLFVPSFIAVPAMFGGGIATAFILKAIEQLSLFYNW